MALDFPVAPILLGFVPRPMAEEKFRRALLILHGDLSIFIDRPISTAFIGNCALLVAQVFMALRGGFRKSKAAVPVAMLQES